MTSSKNKFTFAATTPEGDFDKHIEHSIRGYNNLWGDILKLSEYFVESDTYVVDIGCSTGNLLKEMAFQNVNFAPRVKYVGIEVEENFYPGFDKDEAGNSFTTPTYMREDVKDYTFDDCSLITSIFTLQFMEPRIRQHVIHNIWSGLNVGGAFIFAEKTLAESSKIQDILTFTYYDYKKEHFTEKEILDKEAQLRHLLKPVKEGDLYQLLETAGFKWENIECFWKNFQFAGYIAIK